MRITYFHRNTIAGYSINKVTQTIIENYPDKVEYYMPEHKGSLYARIINIIFTYKRRDKKGINHVTGDVHYCILGLIGCKSVLTVHDLVWLEYQDMSRIKRLVIKLLYVKLPLMFATKVVAISNITKIGLEKYSKRKDIAVIYNAIDRSFMTRLKDQSLTPKNILIIGTNPNKNLNRTITSLEGFDCILTIVGKLSKEQLFCLKKSGIKYINKFNLSNEDIVQEYINCDIVSFISLYEGFGMPIIEGNMVGRPVITSNIPVLKEIGGNSCVYVNPEDLDDMKNGFKRLFYDGLLRAECVKKGLQNVQRFQVDAIMKQWDTLYESL